MSFELHPRLQQDSVYLGRLELCQVLLMNDSQYPWCILVPERENLTEIHQLTRADRILLSDESHALAECLVDLYQPDKLNVAALGNIVTQLHIHHVVRYQTDRAWSAPVWGKFPVVPYSPEQLIKRTIELKARLHNLR